MGWCTCLPSGRGPICPTLPQQLVPRLRPRRALSHGARRLRSLVKSMGGTSGAAQGSTADLIDSGGQLDGKVLSVKERRLSSLWAGYGSITGLTVEVQGASRPLKLIMKTVDPPDDEGVGHNRKVRSYKVEAAFYRRLAGRLREAGVAVPQPLAVEGGGAGEGHVRFVLSDLTESHPVNHHGFDDGQTRAALEWLAGYHAFSWEEPLHEGLWEQGCYWYMDTRMEEFECIGREWARLKAAAPAIDRRMKGLAMDGAKVGSHRTVVHGDYKAANILHSSDGKECAAYDFQYPGESYGVRDVAYLLASSVDRRVADAEGAMLAHYHAALCRRLEARGLGDRAEAYSLEVCTKHYELCLLDYVRFMAGWGWWGNTRYAEGRAKVLLDRLDGGKLLDAAGYEEAIYREFPMD